MKSNHLITLLITSVILAASPQILPAAAEPTTVKTESTTAPKSESADLLQGKWEGTESGRETQGKCTLEVTGNAMHLVTSNKQEWYKATFTLPAGTEPKQLQATITDCPAPDFIGKSAFSIYKIEDGTLTITGNRPGSPNAPKDFKGDSDSRTFVFKKAQP